MKNATVYNETALSEGSERFYRGAKAGEADWDERVASQLTVFAAPGRGTLREAR